MLAAALVLGCAVAAQKPPPPQAYESLWLEKTAAKELKAAFVALAAADPKLHAEFLETFAGALVRSGSDGGLRYDAPAARWEWTVPPAALEFGGPELAGAWAWKCYLRRALLEHSQIVVWAGSTPSGESLAKAGRRLAERSYAAAVDEALWAQRDAWNLGLAPRRRTGKAADRERDPALGLAVIEGRWLLVGRPEQFARLRQVLEPIRADPAALAWLEPVQIFLLQEGASTTATWFYEDKEVGVALGISGAAHSAAAVLQAGLVDKVRGRAVAVAGQADLDLLPLAAIVVGMGVWWHDVLQVRNPPTAAEIEVHRQHEAEAFLLRNRRP